MFKAAVIALHLALRRPSDEMCLPPLPDFEGIQPGFWARVREWQE